MSKAINMPEKAINHVIQAKKKKSKINARKRFRRLGGVEPRKGRLDIRIIPCVFGEERRIKRL